MRYTGADLLMRLLENQGVEHVAGIPGGANLPIYTALAKSSIRHILTRHEQGAGFIAQGIARATGKAGVCFATSGPGATNLLTAIADAKLDSIPVIAITGQVSTALLGTDAFQEIDTYGMTIPITKHNFLVRSARELLSVIPEAFTIALSGRPGPVLIDVPKDVQKEVLEVDCLPPAGGPTATADVRPQDIQAVAAIINGAQRPVLYIGGGIVQAGAQEQVLSLSRRNRIPVVSTLMGLGCFPSDDPLYLGMLGMHGARYTNLILKQADLLLAFGVRFDDRATGKVSEFCPGAQIIHVDIDEAEIDKIKKTNKSISGDIKKVLRDLLPLIHSDERRQWNEQVQLIKTKQPFSMPKTSDSLHPLNLIRLLRSLSADDTIVTTDVGQHQMWTAQVFSFFRPRTLLTSGGLGTMGFGLPAAIGAGLAFPERMVLCISGDGSILMNIQELATLADLRLNVKVVIMNNGHLGLVRQQQELFYKQNYIASKFATNPDFAAISSSFGVPGYDLATARDPGKMLADIMREPGPAVINVPIHFAENVWPMVAPGAGNHEMIGGEDDE